MVLFTCHTWGAIAAHLNAQSRNSRIPQILRSRFYSSDSSKERFCYSSLRNQERTPIFLFSSDPEHCIACIPFFPLSLTPTGVYASPSSFNQFSSNYAGLKGENTTHTHGRKPQQKSGVLQSRELRRAQEQTQSRPSLPGSGRGHRPPRPARGAAAAALPPPTLSRRGYLQVGRGGRHGGDPRRLPGEGLGRRQATGRRRLTPGAARTHAGQRLGTSRLPPSGTCSETARHSDSARPSPRSFRDPSPPRRARVPPLPQNFRFRHQHAPHPVPGCRGLAFALGLARPGRGSRNPAEAWRKSACA